MIRRLSNEDHDIYIAMAKEFYASDAVLNNVPEENLENTFSELMHSDIYTVCYLLIRSENICGYALLSKTYSQEAGGMVLWLEELYVCPQYRSMGLGTEFFEWLENNKGSDIKRIRLEIEPENERAVSLYVRRGFDFFDYSQMVIEL